MATLGAFLLLPFLGLGIWYWATRTSDTDDQLRRIVEKYGYSAVTPPSRLFGPGTFTTVEKLSNGTPQLRPTCIMDDGTLAAKWSKSPTVDESLVSAIEQTFASSPKALDSIESNTTGKRARVSISPCATSTSSRCLTRVSEAYAANTLRMPVKKSSSAIFVPELRCVKVGRSARG